jgi:hypothetical protein
LLFVDANKMVSAPFSRSHENGLPRNYHLREATKMTMLWISAKMVLKKRPPPPQKIASAHFSFFVFFFYFISFFSFLFIHSSAILFLA